MYRLKFPVHKLKFPVLKPKCFQFHTKRTMLHKVFVYGTLKRGEPNHYWLQDAKNGIGKFLADGKTKTKYPLIIATKYNIPFLLHEPGEGHNVEGEVYEVDDNMLSKLDILEDHPVYYIREKDEILTKDNQALECWVYFLKNFKRELLQRPRLVTYSSAGPHGLVYMDRSQRDSSYDHRTVVKPDPFPEHETDDSYAEEMDVILVKRETN